MDGRVVVIGASAGGVEALRDLVAGLPEDFPAPILVVVHVPASARSALPMVLSRSGPLPATHARENQELIPGQILVAPPDRHLIVHDGHAGLRRGPLENRQRPAIDPLFTTAARAYGPGVIAVILSGALDDGAVGAAAVAAQDGVVLVQDPEDARVTSMPRAALTAVRRAITASAKDLAPILVDLTTDPVPAEENEMDADALREDLLVKSEGRAVDAPDTPAALGCPDCYGGMFETKAGGILHYVCHVGHSWSPETLLDAQQRSVESALYNAASKLREVAAVHRRLADLAEGGTTDPTSRERHVQAADRAEQNSRQIIEEMLSGGPDGSSIGLASDDSAADAVG